MVKVNEAENAQTQFSRELLLKKYLAAREKADIVDAEVKLAKKNLEDSLGDITEIHLMGLKVLFRYNTTLDAERIKQEQPKLYFEFLKDPELDIPGFRKGHPELVEKYTIDTKVRPLKVVV